jgi:hypothetical protein
LTEKERKKINREKIEIIEIIKTNIYLYYLGRFYLVGKKLEFAILFEV